MQRALEASALECLVLEVAYDVCASGVVPEVVFYEHASGSVLAGVVLVATF